MNSHELANFLLQHPDREVIAVAPDQNRFPVESVLVGSQCIHLADAEGVVILG